jgi:HIRAN domain
MTAVVDVSFEERYWYPEDGGVVWLTGFQLIDTASGSFIGRDDPQLAERGLRVAGVAGAARHHGEALASSELAPGSVLELRRDPGNEHDPNAIAVRAPGDGGQVGWVPRELAEEIAPELDSGRPWSAVVLREQRPSPRDPRTGLTMLLASEDEIELREVSPGAGRGAGRPRSGAGRTSPRRPGPPR